MNIWDTDYLFLFQIWTLQCQTTRIKRLHDYYVVDIGRPVPLGLSPTMRMAFFYVEDDFDVYQSHKIFFSLQENNKLRQAENRMSVQWVNPDARPRLIEFCQHGLPVLLIRYVSQSPGHRNITTKLLCVYRTSLRVYHILFFLFFSCFNGAIYLRQTWLGDHRVTGFGWCVNCCRCCKSIAKYDGVCKACRFGWCEPLLDNITKGLVVEKNKIKINNWNEQFKMNQPLFGNVEEKSFNSVRYRQQVPLHSVSLQKCCTGLSVKGQSLQRDQTDGI